MLDTREVAAYLRLKERRIYDLVRRQAIPHVRATGSGISYNVGRFATAGGVLAAGLLFTAFGGSYPAVGAAAAMIYGLGMVAIWWAPATARKPLAL